MSAGRPPAPCLCRRPRREVIALPIWIEVLLLAVIAVAAILLRKFGYLPTP